MFRFHLKLTLIMSALFTVLVFARLATFSITNPVEVFLSDQANCDYTCLFQIEPGHTDVGQARTYLNEHDWITDVREAAPGNGYAQVSWGWSGAQPAFIDISQRGKLTFVWDDDDPENTKINDAIVETISIYIHAGIYPFEKYYGTPLNGSANSQLEGMLGYAVYYNRSGGNMALHIELTCPVSLSKYWSASTRLTVSIGQIKNDYVSPTDMISMC
jgi:hypothetical protein